jgi:hypothetical protein
VPRIARRLDGERGGESEREGWGRRELGQRPGASPSRFLSSLVASLVGVRNEKGAETSECFVRSDSAAVLKPQLSTTQRDSCSSLLSFFYSSRDQGINKANKIFYSHHCA